MFEVRLSADPGWRPGPFPVRLPTRSRVADDSLRLTYFEPRLQDVLYGSAAAPVRWHRVVESEERLAGAVVRGIELLRAPLAGEGLGLAVLHVDLADGQEPRRDPAAVLREVARLCTTAAEGSEARKTLEALLPSGVRLLPSAARAKTVAHVTFADGPGPVMSNRYDSWSPVEQWLWLMACATTEERFAPDPDDPAVRVGTVLFSADWRALVLRDGTAFVGMSPDSGGETFHALAEAYVHSTYLDTLLVGYLQLYALNEVANKVAGVPAEEFSADVLAQLEHHLMHVRRRLWFSHITVRGKSNELLRKFQEQHALPTLLENIVSELADAGRLVEALTNRSVNAALGLLTVVGLPVGVVFAAGALWAEPHPRLFVTATLVAAVAATALTVAVRPARHMLKTLLHRRGRSGRGSAESW